MDSGNTLQTKHDNVNIRIMKHVYFFEHFYVYFHQTILRIEAFSFIFFFPVYFKATYGCYDVLYPLV